MPDEAFVKANLVKLIQRDDVIFLVAEGLGFILGRISSEWYDPALSLYEKLLYVLPGFRGSKASPAVELVTAFEEEGKRLGCVAVHVGSTTGINETGVVKFYEAMGYRRAGTILNKSLEALYVRT